MGQERVESALGRIERAIARIECASARASASAEASDNGLRQAHEALRRRVREALAELDGLIAVAERG